MEKIVPRLETVEVVLVSNNYQQASTVGKSKNKQKKKEKEKMNQMK